MVVSNRRLIGVGVRFRGSMTSQQSTALLLSAYHRGGDRAARDRVIEQNLPLVQALARRFSRRASRSRPRPGRLDRPHQGRRRLPRGARDDLGAYAVPTIVGEMRRHVHDRPTGTTSAHRVPLPRRSGTTSGTPVGGRARPQRGSHARSFGPASRQPARAADRGFAVLSRPQPAAHRRRGRAVAGAGLPVSPRPSTNCARRSDRDDAAQHCAAHGRTYLLPG